MSVTDLTVFEKRVAYSRSFIVDRCPCADCDRCKTRTVCLYIDSSDGEYGGAALCRACLLELIDTVPSIQSIQEQLPEQEVGNA